MQTIRTKFILLLLLLSGSGCLLVWAGNKFQENQYHEEKVNSTNGGKPWDSLSLREQQQVLSYWDILTGLSKKNGVQLKIIRNSKSLVDGDIRNYFTIDTTIVTKTSDWILFQSADTEMFYTQNFNSVLDRVQEVILLLPPNPIVDNNIQAQQQITAIKPQDYFISIQDYDSECIVHLENPEHLNLTSIDLIYNKSMDRVTNYSMINPNYSAAGNTGIQYDVQIEERKLDKQLLNDVLNNLWIDYSHKRTPVVKSIYKQFSISNLLQP